MNKTINEEGKITIESYLPCFTGFYDTYFTLSDCHEDNERDSIIEEYQRQGVILLGDESRIRV